jgi:hypothetical protein
MGLLSHAEASRATEGVYRVEAFVERRLELGDAAEVVVRFGRPLPGGEDHRRDRAIRRVWRGRGAGFDSV